MEWFDFQSFGPVEGPAAALFGVLFLIACLGMISPSVTEHKAKFGLSALPSGVIALGIVLWSALLLVLTAGLFGLIFVVLSSAIPAEDAQWDWRFTLAQITALTAVLGAVVVLPITLNRLRLQREANVTAERQLEKERESLFNEKINAATEDLYARRQRSLPDSDRDVWEDDITRRNAAIDRLYGLVEERPDEAERVSRLLSVYVRELSAEEECPAVVVPEYESQKQIKEWARGLSARSDMENAVQVLGRLRGIDDVKKGAVRIDLRGSNLQGMDFEGGNFDDALLRGAQLQGADLREAQLQGANLKRAQLQGAILRQARLQRANLERTQLLCADLGWAQLNDADLAWAQLQGAFLGYANLQSADLFGGQLQKVVLEETNLQNAQLIEADLRGAQLGGAKLQGTQLGRALLQGACLVETQLQGAYLGGAQLQGADLGGAEMDEATDLCAATMLGAALWSVDGKTIERLQPFWPDIFADGSVQVPEGAVRPWHWAEDELAEGFFGTWRAWQRSIGQDPENPE